MTSHAFDDLNEQMLNKFFSINPDSATTFGRHVPYDRHLPHGGYRRVTDNLKLLTDWRKSAEDIAGSGNLSDDQQTSLEVLEMTLNLQRFVVEDYPLWKMMPNAFEAPGSAMLIMMVRDYAPLEQRLAWMASRIGELPRYMKEFRERYGGARTVRAWTQNALEACRGFPSFLDTVQSLAKTGASPEVHAEMARNAAEAIEEFGEHEDWLVGMLDTSVDNFAMGRDKFAKLLRIRGFALTPDEMEELAAKYLSDFKDRRDAVAKRISGDGGVRSARDVIEADSPKSNEDVILRARTETDKAMKFVADNDLVTVIKDSRVQVMRTPDFMKTDIPTAATCLPAVFEDNQDTVFLITPTREPEEIKSVWNVATIINTVVHEAYPGHHLQGTLSNRKPWMHQLPHIVYTPETLAPPYESQEGWAHYCEVLMHEKGFCGSDSDEFTMLDFAILRACRVFLDVRLAHGEATIEDITEMLVREMGMPRESARGEVVGFSRAPGYGLCYLIGRHMVMELKDCLRSDLGDRFSEKRYHDLVAENGNLPFSLAKTAILRGMTAK